MLGNHKNVNSHKDFKAIIIVHGGSKLGRLFWLYGGLDCCVFDKTNLKGSGECLIVCGFSCYLWMCFQGKNVFIEIVVSFLEWFFLLTRSCLLTFIESKRIWWHPIIYEVEVKCQLIGSGCQVFGELWCMCWLFRCFEKQPFKLVIFCLIRKIILVWCDRGYFHFRSGHVFDVVILDACNIFCNVCFNFLLGCLNIFPDLLMTLIFPRRSSKDAVSE